MENEFWGRGFVEEATRKKITRTAETESIEHVVLSGDGEFIFLGLKDGES